MPAVQRSEHGFCAAKASARTCKHDGVVDTEDLGEVSLEDLLGGCLWRRELAGCTDADITTTYHCDLR